MVVGARRTVLAAVCLLLGATMSSGPAAAAPVTFVPGTPLRASCDGDHPEIDPDNFEHEWTLVPLPGRGAFSPYLVVETGQRLVPSEFRILVGPMPAKTRHDTRSGTWIKPGGGVPSSTECWISGEYLDGGERMELTAIILGELV